MEPAPDRTTPVRKTGRRLQVWLMQKRQDWTRSGNTLPEEALGIAQPVQTLCVNEPDRGVSGTSALPGSISPFPSTFSL